ncbi:hypothetical protein A3A20_02905 [Candidatus Wolfebacteria bacterium RIFCSPLOWO2_01_FULL_45_19]|uniref:UTP--glucose-1-phosphate uridylyltransferase n=1 Tax=Candidatus Wolfebacteria bacterium RIFCSPLOWO2_01_FULL_45_19 TaxID=1802557 RepID=A0A1F8DS90_9BACT|nr:MAG: UTP-glucose-1-phosphate uridylyltransferase [Parcubacteria group bacterium GW2011_GWB1_45_9]OGM91491.1 MAG: hypothetical protein A3A20_02905 [Candidatus Wolfebacteria bacterium RIFCSPLOWO2_01_FULL_45_19]
MSIKKAIVAVAGMGTRLLPATKALSKEMLPIVDKPVIQWIAEDISAAGINDIIFVTGKNKRALEEHFNKNPELENFLVGQKDLLKATTAMNSIAKFSFVRQNEPRGNADAIKQALRLLHNEPALVMWGDEILIGGEPVKRHLELFEKLRHPLLVLYQVPREKISSYGIVKVRKTDESDLYEILNIVEKPRPEDAPSNLAAVGRYALTPEVFSLIDDVGITEVLQRYLKQGGKVYGWEFKGERFDCGSKIGLLKAAVYYGLRHPEISKEFNEYLKDIV